MERDGRRFARQRFRSGARRDIGPPIPKRRQGPNSPLNVIQTRALRVTRPTQRQRAMAAEGARGRGRPRRAGLAVWWAWSVRSRRAASACADAPRKRSAIPCARVPSTSRSQGPAPMHPQAERDPLRSCPVDERPLAGACADAPRKWSAIPCARVPSTSGPLAGASGVAIPDRCWRRGHPTLGRWRERGSCCKHSGFSLEGWRRSWELASFLWPAVSAWLPRRS